VELFVAEVCQLLGRAVDPRLRLTTVLLLATAAVLFVPGVERPAFGQSGEEPPAALMLVMDSSGSMNGNVGGGGTKLDAAKDALRAVVDELPDGLPTGLTVYGHTQPNDAPRDLGCGDVEVVVPVVPLDRQRMVSTIDGYDASGFEGGKHVGSRRQ
jgi:Ca-activated chloride channel family protein